LGKKRLNFSLGNFISIQGRKTFGIQFLRFGQIGVNFGPREFKEELVVKQEMEERGFWTWTDVSHFHLRPDSLLIKKCVRH